MPGGVTLTVAGCGQINLQWTESTDAGGSGVRGYKIYRDNLFVKEVAAPATGTTDTGLMSSHTYSYQVSAVDNAQNESARSTAQSASTPVCNIPWCWAQPNPASAAPGLRYTIYGTGFQNAAAYNVFIHDSAGTVILSTNSVQGGTLQVSDY